MNKRIKLLAFLALFAMTTSISAGVYKSVLLKRTDGTTMNIGIDSGIEIALSNGNYVISGEKGSIEVPYADVRSWSFSKSEGMADWSGVENLPADASLSITVIDNEIRVSGLSAPSVIQLIDLGGRILENIDSIYGCSVSIADRPAGIYILSVNGHSIKIVKR